MTETKKKVPSLRFPEFSGEWEEKKLGEIANKITDGTHDTPHTVEQGIPYLTAIHVKDGFIDYESCYYVEPEVHEKIYQRCNPEKGDLLIVNIGAGTANCALNKVDYQFSLKNVALIKPNRRIIAPSFLEQVQRKNAKFLFHRITSGGAQPFLGLKDIEKIKINIPKIPEQEKIGDFLSTIDERIQLLKEKKKTLEAYKKGVMQQIFSQQLRFKDENGNDYPDWDYKGLGEVLEYEQPTKYLVSSTEYNNSNSTPVLTAGKTFILGYTNEDFGIFPKNELPVIIFDDFTTDSKYVNFEFKAKSSAMKILKAKENNIKYIYEAMQQIKYIVGGHGRHWISVFSSIEIPYPSLPEQQKIADFLSSIDDKISFCDQQIKQAEQYKKGLLQQMFV